ncbi:hypothetical protein F5Y19DRAFT_491909 [Xylariaceae sp. FL1651]|nr:hypothetical protein F5Y19DRAFT_491909 [Xylariaceae sp. FL1651]
MRIIPFVVTTAVFIFLNFASSGYDLVLQISSDPNTTISGGAWLHHWPSYLTTKVKRKYESATFPVNFQLFTNQMALAYTLTSVWSEMPDGRTAQSILSTSNTTLSTELANQISLAEWCTVVQTFVMCQIQTSNGAVFFNLTQTYDYVPATIDLSGVEKFLGTEFLDRNATERARLCYIANQRADNQTMMNITSPSFFHIEYRFIAETSHAIPFGTFDIWASNDVSLENTAPLLNQANVYPHVWFAADLMAKSAWSTVLTDLGQTTKTESNFLADASTATYMPTIRKALGNVIPGPATVSYAKSIAAGSNETTGPLLVTFSVFSA